MRQWPPSGGGGHGPAAGRYSRTGATPINTVTRDPGWNPHESGGMPGDDGRCAVSVAPDAAPIRTIEERSRQLACLPCHGPPVVHGNRAGVVRLDLSGGLPSGLHNAAARISLGGPGTIPGDHHKGINACT